MVANTVNVPHGLPASALTTTSASTASRMIMIASTPNCAMNPATAPISGADQVAERAAVAAGRNEENDEILHRAGEDDADQQPQRAGQIAHLRREHRADQRACPGDGREMMAEQHLFVGRHVIEPVIAAMRRRWARIVEAERLFGDELL